MHLTGIIAWRDDGITPLFTDLVVDGALELAIRSIGAVSLTGLRRHLLVFAKPFVAEFILGLLGGGE